MKEYILFKNDGFARRAETNVCISKRDVLVRGPAIIRDAYSLGKVRFWFFWLQWEGNFTTLTHRDLSKDFTSPANVMNSTSQFCFQFCLKVCFFLWKLNGSYRYVAHLLERHRHQPVNPICIHWEELLYGVVRSSQDPLRELFWRSLIALVHGNKSSP